MSPIQLQLLNNGPAALKRLQTNGSEEESQEEIESVGSDYDSDSERNVRRSRRMPRAGYQFSKSISTDYDDEDNSASSDSLISGPGTTSRSRRLRRGVRKGSQKSSRQSTRQTSLISDSDSYRPRGTRQSTRHRETRRSNLREQLEDDISEHELDRKEKKFFGVREVFHSIPNNNPFRRRHLNTCDVCNVIGNDPVKGPLVFCQGCTFAYHQACLGGRANRDHLVTKVADNEFVLQCRRCLGVPHSKDSLCPHEGHCTVCGEEGQMSKPLRERLTPKQEEQLRQSNDGKDPITQVDSTLINNVDNLLFRCVGCRRAYHYMHFPALGEDESNDVAKLRFEQYSENWKCLDCLSVPGEIGTMVAWRPVDDQATTHAASKTPEDKKEYLIKWKNMSYHRTTWMPGPWVRGVAPSAMRRAFFRTEKDVKPQSSAEEAIPEDYLRIGIVFDVKYSDRQRKRTQEDDFARVDKVTEAYVKFDGLPYEECVWETPPKPDSERWGDFVRAYEDWVRRDYIHVPDQTALKKHLANVHIQNFSTIAQDAQPDSMVGGDIMEFQIDGLNWLYYMWYKQRNAILADEMGLGKTIQVIGLFATLIQYHKCWPFLVVAPNPTCPNWRKEIKKWVPSIRVVTYFGSSTSRKLAQEYEMFSEGSKDLRCHVVVTSYEAIVDDNSCKMLSKIPWAGLVVDEGQRLKNDKSQIYDSLSRIQFPFKILLTGTPLQNNTRELFNLLQFCDPSINAERLEAEYEILSKDNIPKLHEMIRLFFLRRTKAQVLNFLPPIANIIVPVSMSVVQKKLYKSILAKNPSLIQAIFQRNRGYNDLKQPERKNLNNILMQLRKCLCHPFCYSKAIEEQTADVAASHRHLVEAAGKLQLLRLMLPKLQQRGHRTLIFSQFLENLNIVEDFLDGIGILHRRLDGRMTSLQKQKQIDDYNAEGSPYFAFLLSTRSGGIGINLATADTVIIMDPDFNPHQDMQASSRAHRIGQKHKVLVFQLMTRGSVEEKIMQIGKRKMVLDHVLIDRMISEEVDGHDLESILRHGAQALFEGDDSGDIHYDSESIDKLLDRSQVEQNRASDQSGNEDPLSFARVWANDNQNLDGQLADGDEGPVDSSVWENILKEREIAAAEENEKKDAGLGRGKRKRTAVDYTNTSGVSPVKQRQDPAVEDESDMEFKDDNNDENDDNSDGDSDPGMASDEIELSAKKRKGNTNCCSYDETSQEGQKERKSILTQLQWLHFGVSTSRMSSLFLSSQTRPLALPIILWSVWFVTKRILPGSAV